MLVVDDEEGPRQSLRVIFKDDYEILIVGGEDHKTGQANDPDQRFLNLEKWARERFPEVQSVEYRWSGQTMEPIDFLGFIGRNPLDAPNVYIATGDSGAALDGIAADISGAADFILSRGGLAG